MANVFLHDQTNRFVGVYGANGRITVNCPSGYTVKATCGDIEHTATADETGKVVFTGLNQGTWSVEVDGGQQTITKAVEVITEYEIDMEFISAVINIDYPNGSRCTCTNGIVEYEAPDDTGRWNLTVGDAGTWTVTCTNGVRTETRVVEITRHGQVENVDITYFEATIIVTFPVGATCTCYKDGLIHSTPDYSGTSTISTITHNFVVGEAGQWTVACVKDGRTEFRYATITSDGQVAKGTIEFFEATLEITYPAGYYCTCTYGDYKYTSPDTSGVWTLPIPDPGTWTVSCTNNGLVKSKTVDITTDGETKTVDIDYFLATVNVLYPEGCVCTIDLNGTIHEAPDTSGNWVFEASEAGTCNVVCVTDVGSKSESIAITSDWQTEYVNLTEFEARINITYPAGATCICSNSDGSTTHRAPNTSGNWTLVVPRTGTWNVTAWNDEQEVSESVEIIGDGQRVDVTIKFFAATIKITYPAGATCTCTDGTSLYRDTEGSGYWVLTVPRTNEWEIRVTLNGQSIAGSVVVEYDGQVIDKTVKFFEAIINITYPVGAACICTDDNGYTYYAPDNSGSWTQKVPRTGTWRISAELDGRTCNGTVVITADEQVEYKTVKFFAATINITYTAGYPCICYSSDKIYEYEAPDTSGSWELTVPCTGTWVIEAESDEQTASGTVEITADEQVENITVKFFKATISVYCETALTGLTCTDGINEYEYFDITAGAFTRINVPRTGTWTVTATTDSLTGWSDDVSTTTTTSITDDGQYKYLTMTFAKYSAKVTSTSSLPVHTAILYQVESDDSRSKIYSQTFTLGTTSTKTYHIYKPGDYTLYMYREAPYDGVESGTAKFYSVEFTVTQNQINNGSSTTYTPSYRYLPIFTYSVPNGYKIVDDSGKDIYSDGSIPEGNWNIQFLETGTLKFTELNGAGEGIDVFVCGGGGNGGHVYYKSWSIASGGGGGGGGYRTTSFGESIVPRTTYAITIGGAGGSSAALNGRITASGGGNGGDGTASGVGAAGIGGSKGGTGNYWDSECDGEDGDYAFMGATGRRYGGGGGAGVFWEYGEILCETINGNGHESWLSHRTGGAGGLDGGGASGDTAMANSGGGGGGGDFRITEEMIYDDCDCFTIAGLNETDPGTGGSGIVIIRNKR